jgi:2-polyprenyl-6-hydroxyphenyl methylase/3-demethylubiquinone-9 3-methyltransferase
MSGIPVYYHRCGACGFLFTTAFDAFSHADFQKWIYNEQYAHIDPDYAAVRPSNNTRLVSDFVGPNYDVPILDYGSGNGLLARNLRELGYHNVTEYDPFVAGASHRPSGLFECITAFEVLEHSIDPRKTLLDMASLLGDPGLILFSTCVQNERIVTTGMNWWYIGPRNGHASVYSRRSLELLAGNLSLGFGSFNDVVHIMCRQVPAFAKSRITFGK